MPRSRERVIRDFVQGWLRKAGADLQAAEKLLELPQEDYFTAAFHAQQTVEKLLKAFLVRHQILFPKTHDIGRLLDLASSQDPSLASVLGDAAALTPYGVEFRYPLEEVVSVIDAQRAVEIATRAREAVMMRLHDYLDRVPP